MFLVNSRNVVTRFVYFFLIANVYSIKHVFFLFLDVEGIKYVINFDYPNSSEDYIHRIGRTGRCQSKGTSYAFFTPSNSRQARDLVSVLQEANQVSYAFIHFTNLICDPLNFGMGLLDK